MSFLSKPKAVSFGSQSAEGVDRSDRPCPAHASRRGRKKERETSFGGGVMELQGRASGGDTFKKELPRIHLGASEGSYQVFFTFDSVQKGAGHKLRSGAKLSEVAAKELCPIG